MSYICLRTCFSVNSMSLVNFNLTKDKMLTILGLTSYVYCGHSIGLSDWMSIVGVSLTSGSFSPQDYI